jgi:hypothetical protein
LKAVANDVNACAMVSKSGRIADGAALARFWKSATAAVSLNFAPVALAIA